MNELHEVVAYVEKIRADDGITEVGRDWLPEVSSQTYRGGEIALLVEWQLARTEFGFGAWLELRSPHVLRAVRKYIMAEAFAHQA